MQVEKRDEIADRKREQELFRNLLTFKDDARLLAINDAGGRGKSTLLRRLRYNCTYNTSRVAHSLIPWNEHPGWSFFDLVKAIHDDFEKIDLGFPEFRKLSNYLASRDFAPFKADFLAKGHADFRSATISGGQQAAIIMEANTVNLAHLATTATPAQSSIPWNPEMEEEARRQCVSTFLKELRNSGNEQPTVIMLDAWEHCTESLKIEILNKLILPFCFNLDTRPRWFILVIAGRKSFPFEQMLGDTRFSQLVRSIPSLNWEREHVKEFLEINGYNELSDEDIDFISNKVSRGMSLDAAIALAKQLHAISSSRYG